MTASEQSAVESHTSFGADSSHQAGRKQQADQSTCEIQPGRANSDKQDERDPTEAENVDDGQSVSEVTPQKSAKAATARCPAE